MRIKIGTRKSKLALIQTNLVIDEIKKHYPELECEIVPIVTTGDQITDRNLYDIGGKALFLKEIENALLDKKIDIAIHSLKDVPGSLPEGLELRACLEREDLRDVFVSMKASSIKKLPQGSTIGSSSVRRKLFINQMRPDIKVAMFRGNVDTRITKLMEGQVDATILAAAGLSRLEAFNSDYCFPIDPEEMMPAVGQGVIVIEIRSNNNFAAEICDTINHKPTWQLIKPERAFMEYLNADCRTPLASFTRLTRDNTLRTKFMLADFDGNYVLMHQDEAQVEQGKEMGYRAARTLISKIPNICK